MLRTLQPFKMINPHFRQGKSLANEVAPSSQATTPVSDGPAQVLLSLSPMAGHLILINRCPCQLPSRRNACHSRAELARAEAQEGEETASHDPAT